MKQTLGFIGLGIMGKPIVKNLLEAGYKVHVYDRNKESIKEMEGKGAVGEKSSYDVAVNADIIMIMVPNTPHVQEVIFGEDGVSKALKTGKIVVDMSTISSVETQNIAEEIKKTGARMLDAPVSGGEKGAIEATLSIMVGGEDEPFEKCKEIFEVIGGRVNHVGGNSAGQVVKSCNQVLAAGTIAAMCEALVLGTKSGVDPNKIIEVLSGGAAKCWAIDVRAPYVVERDFEPGFKSQLQYKDLGLALELSKNINAPMPITGVVNEVYKSIMSMGLGEEDHTNIIRVYEELAGIQVKGGNN